MFSITFLSLGKGILTMATKGCNFCGKVGIQPIKNERTSFNYSSLEVRKKEEKKSKTLKNETAPRDELQVSLLRAYMNWLHLRRPFFRYKI